MSLKEEPHDECKRSDTLRVEVERLKDTQREAVVRSQRERDILHQWVNDLQAGMFINCVYCGHRYGPNDKVPTTMSEVLKKHIEVCPKHPLSQLRKGVAQVVAELFTDIDPDIKCASAVEDLGNLLTD